MVILMQMLAPLSTDDVDASLSWFAQDAPVFKKGRETGHHKIDAQLCPRQRKTCECFLSCERNGSKVSTSERVQRHTLDSYGGVTISGHRRPNFNA